MRSKEEIKELLNEMKDAVGHYDHLIKNRVPLALHSVHVERATEVDMCIELLEWVMTGKEVDWDWRAHRNLKRWLTYDEEQEQRRKEKKT